MKDKAVLTGAGVLALAVAALAAAGPTGGSHRILPASRGRRRNHPVGRLYDVFIQEDTMKKALVVFLMSVMGFSAFAQDSKLTVSAFANIDLRGWEVEALSDAVSDSWGKSSAIGFSLSGGYFLWPGLLALGVDTGFNFYNVDGNTDSSSISAGPFVEYFFHPFPEYMNISCKGIIHYTRYNDSFELNSYVNALDANRLTVAFSLNIYFPILRECGVEVGLKVMDFGYTYTWFTLDKWEYRHHRLLLAGLFANPSFGITVKF
jgi:hypothetical protein